ncbi:DUF6473 family protein [Limimaricola cinnabarinus]|uniref:DUF6473 family protein n=1 Tax=Limimaricola cinnabarinus TaxID=1125964 RepID=UPI002FE3ED1C
MGHDGNGQLAGTIARVRYEGSRLDVRGPRRRLTGRYIACPGGTETFGPGLEAPFVALLERRIGQSCINLGALNAGAGAHLNDAALLDICGRAERVVLQVTGAHGVSNRLFTVHPRRNDRFLKASPVLRSLYPDIDFTEFCYTRHMLLALKAHDAARFETLREEMCTAWTMRMRKLISGLAPPVTLVVMSERRGKAGLGEDPLFVTPAMVEALRPIVDGIVTAPRPHLPEAARHRAVARALGEAFALQAA